MNASQATTTMLLLFALRCLVPMALMFGIGYAMNRMVDKWELEAAGNKEIGLGKGTAVITTATDNCWSIIKCDPEERKNCPGFKQQKIPCWLARTQAEGVLPEKCVTCPLYEPTSAFA